MPTSDRQAGFTLLGLLFVVAGLGVAMAAVGTAWETRARREKEAELLFVGEQYAQAIAGYQRAAPGAAGRPPPRLEALLADPRFPHTVRHLRRAYPDPMTGKPGWGLTRDESGGIVGVHSLSGGAPLKKSGFRPGREGFADAQSYRDWVFLAVARPPAAAGALSAPPQTSAQNPAVR